MMTTNKAGEILTLTAKILHAFSKHCNIKLFLQCLIRGARYSGQICYFDIVGL